MNLEESYLRLHSDLKETPSHSYSNKEIISLIDLTLLDLNATPETLKAFAAKANQYNVAAVCAMPEHLSLMNTAKGINLATVINFPQGKQTTKQVLASIEQLLMNSKVDEIDYVFPYSSYLKDEQQAALLQCQQAYQLCQQENICFKVILETGAFPDLQSIYQLSTEILATGCDFLKTSTGKIPQGATLSAAFAMLKAIDDSKVPCGLKVSGGIKKREEAINYMQLATAVLKRDLDKNWFRIGASSLLDEL